MSCVQDNWCRVSSGLHVKEEPVFFQGEHELLHVSVLPVGRKTLKRSKTTHYALNITILFVTAYKPYLKIKQYLLLPITGIHCME